jgi:hypothetical protein
MTESEWLECNDPTLMLAFLRGKASDRRLRLSVCACYPHGYAQPNERQRAAFEGVELYLEGKLPRRKARASAIHPLDHFFFAVSRSGQSRARSGFAVDSCWCRRAL